ncbi:hypothetical protein P4H67_15740 [Paenibacillus lautus]|jgi:hypothetical protein|uniref:hypothetical protein n=1 Tax=Paenibacillus lautus TaxID=1401 RepID=UPI002565A6E7|nr:hypothetical protein [Paenibacillus lautus]MDL1164092.1 hypothetical protein [Yersinia pestis]MEC0308205.1 hypothetical protein [Paenibacillus lautus]
MRLSISKRLIFTMIVIMMLIAGSHGPRSNDSYEVQNATEEERILHEIDYLQIHYTQLLYTKTSPEFTWEYRSIECLDPVIQQLYDDGINMAPGGWVLKETDQEIYLLVSGGQLPSARGFRIASMKMASGQPENEKNHLYITLASQQDEGTEGYPGQASVTSLISIPKSGLPDGAAIQGISMTGVD